MQTEYSESLISKTASLVLKNSSILVFYLSQEGKFVYANEKFIQEIGFSLSELLGRSIFELSPHLTNSVWMMMISSSQEMNYTLTFALRTMNGKTLPMEATIQSINSSNERYICCLGRDISNQKKLEELIGVQNSILDSISRLNKIGTWEYDIQQSKLNWSHEMYAIHNVSTSYNPSFEKMLQFFENNSRTDLLFLFEQLMNGSIKNISIEVPLQTEHRNKVWIMLNASAEKTSSNTIFKIYGTYQDVTDKINDNIRFSSLYDRYLRATKAARTGIFEFNIQTQEMYWDQTMLALYDVDENTFSKTNLEWNQQVYPDDIERVNKSMFASIDNKTQVYEEFRIRTKYTTLRWLRVIAEARYDYEGNPTHFVGVNIDISEQKKKDTDLVQSNQFFHSVFSSVDQAIFVIEKSIEGKIVYTDSNPAHERLSGIKREELIGKSPEEIPVLVNDKISKILLQKYTECFNNNEIIEYEENIIVNGKKNWWFTRLTPITNENGEVFRVIASSLDTTKLKQTEEQLLKKNQMFQSITALQQEFISTRFSMHSLHSILLDCMNNTSSTFGLVAEVTDEKIQCLVPISSITVLSALVKKSNGAVKQAIPSLYPMILEADDLFKPATLESFVFQNVSTKVLKNSAFSPLFPEISTFVLKPLKMNKKLIGFLMLANSSQVYSKEICDEISPLTTTIETIFAGYKIMQKESIMTSVVSELLPKTSQNSGIELFEIVSESLTKVLSVECACILKIVNGKISLLSSYINQEPQKFPISDDLYSFFESISTTEDETVQHSIPDDLQEEQFINQLAAKKYIFKKIVNNNDEVIGMICLFHNTSFQFAEIIHSTLSFIAIKVSAEMVKVANKAVNYFKDNEIHENNELYYSAFLNNPDPIFIITSQRPYTIRNYNQIAKKWVNILTNDQKEIQGVELEHLFPIELYTTVDSVLQKCINSSANNFTTLVKMNVNTQFEVTVVKIESTHQKLFQFTIK
ncbi:MAG: PAS domain S-box protein [Candidatus Kapabacteria bacterium]|nr:PAS domain S-box protein [Candidatus Kapabacteria bacterium]